MSEKLLNKNLRAGEKLIETYKEYFIVYWWHGVLSIVLILLPFFFLYPLFSYRLWGILAFMLFLTLGIIIGIRAFFLYNNNIFIVTDKRILGCIQQGLFHKAVKETDFDNIAEISYNKKGLFATIFNYGDIKIQTKNEGINYRIRRVKNPDKVREEIHHTQIQCLKQNAQN
ncbi:PH domain-containing protein [Patescibacteria group bacterium]|nr:PH domain-containing protein [Patescibacteria group bacterium]MBU1673210.1 PH domain-containing protein [Patescibacteria group bacterium]MBU1963092.1 PH domain-containing protein [Patescibacteria group bacterium]